MLKSILVATDASPSSNRAIDLAAHLAAQNDSALHILHVMREMQLPTELLKMAEVERITGDRDDVMTFVADKILDDAKARAEGRGARVIDATAERGDPAGVIVDAAKRHAADLIVVGTRGLGKVETLLMGSVSRKVTNLSGVSCLIVR